MKTSRQKVSLLVGCALHIFWSTALSAEWDLDDIDMESHVTHYNSLSTVEDSDAKLMKTAQFTPFLSEAEEVVTRYEFEPFVGLRLVHRHFILGQNQVMAEAFKVVNLKPSLVTSAQLLEDAREIKAVPSSWIFSNQQSETVKLFETSTDSAVKAANKALQNSPEFLDEMGNLLRSHNLTEQLSLAVLKRDSLVASEGQIYVELNDDSDKESVVQIWREGNPPKETIRTSWSFKGPKQHVCRYISYCIPSEGKFGNRRHIRNLEHEGSCANN